MGKDAANTNTPGLVTSDEIAASQRKRHGHKIWRIALPLVAAVIVGAGGAVGWYLLRDHSIKKSDKTTDSTIADNEPRQTIGQIAAEQAYDGDYAGAMALVDKNLATAKDPAKKSDLLSTKATLAYNHGDYKQALEFAQAADTATSTHSSLVLAAQSAEALGNKKLAVTYYQKLVKTTKTYEVEEYQAKVDELSK